MTAREQGVVKWFNDTKGFESKLKEVTQRLDTLAANPDASFDILIRAFKASTLAVTIAVFIIFIAISFKEYTLLVRYFINAIAS